LSSNLQLCNFQGITLQALGKSFYILVLFACQIACRQDVKHTSADVFKYLDWGDSFYARNSSTQDFIDASFYYDTAYAIANELKDDTVLAAAYFAKGRLCDAWLHDANKTAYYYNKASELYKKINSTDNSFLTAALAIHANSLSGNITSTNNSIRALIKDKPDTALTRQSIVIALLSNIACKVQLYDLAEELLLFIDKKKLSSGGFNSHNKYYEAQFMVYNSKHPGQINPYLDSMAAKQRSGARFDSVLVQLTLYNYYKGLGATTLALKALETYDKLEHQIHVPEKKAVFSARIEQLDEKTNAYKNKIAQQKNIITWIIAVLIISVVIASLWWVYITNRMRARTESYNTNLQQKITEIETLSQEMHHRIKNNIYMVYSMLKMQEKNSSSLEQKQLIGETTSRINSMALMHEQLFYKQSTKQSLSKYLAKVVSSVCEQFSHNKQLHIDTQIDNVNIPNKDILPLGLLINELLTNTIKYATPPADALLRITLSIAYKEDGVILEYYDNGIASTEEKKEGLGIRLIQLLARQINAQRIEIADKPYYYKLKLRYE
jgi:two-component sensor histidine kinase